MIFHEIRITFFQIYQNVTEIDRSCLKIQLQHKKKKNHIFKT